MESNGFGEPKHLTLDYQLPDDNGDSDSEKLESKLVNIDIPTTNPIIDDNESQGSNKNPSSSKDKSQPFF